MHFAIHRLNRETDFPVGTGIEARPSIFSPQFILATKATSVCAPFKDWRIPLLDKDLQPFTGDFLRC
jgi:hypothetical protein